jgi:hypothetical protein
LTHFVFTESIAEAIVNIASDEARHESLLKARTKARTVWAKLRRDVRNQGAQSQEGPDMQLVAIQNYLDELGEDASREPYSGLASTCSMVLRGEGANSLKSECLATISWQETQMMAAMSVIDFLLYKDLISEPLDYKTAMTVSVDDSFVTSLWTEFRSIQELEDMQHSRDLCFPVYFPDAVEWILQVVAYNRSFSLHDIKAAVQSHLSTSSLAVSDLMSSLTVF